MISKETIEAVRERADIVQVIGETVRLKRQGRRMIGLCPFHKEKTPSFSVNPDRGVFHCFGCKESGSVFDFLMKIEGLSFPEAVRNLADRLGVVIDEASPEQRDAEQRQREERTKLTDLNELVAQFFQAQMGPKGHPLAFLAHEELERRGLPFSSEDEHVREALEGFRIGYAPYGWDGLSSYLSRQGIDLQLAESLGLIGKRRSGSGFFDAFRHRLMFAVVNKIGQVVAFSGRALREPTEQERAEHRIAPMYRDDGTERRPPPKYINSPESRIYVKGDTVFGLHQARHEVRRRTHSVLVEGNFDVVALHARGLPVAVAPLGTALTENQARLLRRYAPTAVVMFDGDEAGRKATAACRIPARSVGLSLKAVSLPSGQDPDDFVQQHGIEVMERTIGGARGMLEYLIEETLGEGAEGGSSLKDKQARIEQVLRYLAEETDPNVRSMAKAYADKISAQLVIDGRSPSDIRSLEAMVRKALMPQAAPDEAIQSQAPATQGPSARSRPRGQDISLSVLGCLFDFPELFEEPKIVESMSVVDGDAALVVAAMRQMWDEKNSLEVEHLLDLTPPAIHSFAAARLAAPVFLDRDNARRELLDNTRKLRRIALKDDNAVRLDALAQAERLGDKQAEDELLEELARRSRERHGL